MFMWWRILIELTGPVPMQLQEIDKKRSVTIENKLWTFDASKFGYLFTAIGSAFPDVLLTLGYSLALKLHCGVQ